MAAHINEKSSAAASTDKDDKANTFEVDMGSRRLCFQRFFEMEVLGMRKGVLSPVCIVFCFPRFQSRAKTQHKHTRREYSFETFFIAIKKEIIFIRDLFLSR